MNTMRLKAGLIATALTTALILTGCGGSGTISSLTDSDSAAAVADGAAPAEVSTAVAGAVSAAETAVSTVPEIAPQTIAATEITSAPTANTSTAPGSITAPTEEITPAPAAGGEISLLSDASPVSPEVVEEISPEVTEEVEVAEPVAEPEPVVEEPEEEEEEAESEEESSEGSSAEITGDEVNVREEPTTADGDDNVLFTLDQGTEVVILDYDEDGNWAKISVDGETGWVSASFVSSGSSDEGEDDEF